MHVHSVFCGPSRWTDVVQVCDGSHSFRVGGRQKVPLSPTGSSVALRGEDSRRTVWVFTRHVHSLIQWMVELTHALETLSFRRRAATTWADVFAAGSYQCTSMFLRFIIAYALHKL